MKKQTSRELVAPLKKARSSSNTKQQPKQTAESVQVKSYNFDLKGGKHPDMLLVARKRLELEVAKKQKMVKKVTLAIRRSNKSSLGLLKRHS